MPPRPKGAVLVVVAVIAAAGALGFTLAHTGGNEREIGPSVAADPARVHAERQRALLGKTDAILARLDRGRAVARRRLATAATRRGQAAAAAELAADYRSARRMLPPESRAVARLESALHRAGQAYSRLARAARSGDRRGYARASGAVRRRESDLQQTIAQLNHTRLTP